LPSSGTFVLLNEILNGGWHISQREIAAPEQLAAAYKAMNIRGDG